MKITIDYNNDMVMINPDERYEDSEMEYNFSDLKRGNNIQSLLEEIINKISDGVKNISLNVELESLNEENRTSIGEW
jgi:hypothetical protein